MEGGWFYESSNEFPGQKFGLEVNRVLFDKKSKYQDVLVFESNTYGNVLALDGIIQCSERDEFCYQEMITFLPLNSHPSPKRVLIIGGGDGGVVREVVKHPAVESVDLCEIDEMVIEASKMYLPSMSVGYRSPKLTVYVEDGFEFMKQRKNHYDVIISDTSDPQGPAAELFKEKFFMHVKTALKDNGLLCAQGECIFLDLKLIKAVLKFCQDIFPVTSYAYSSVPSYTSGNLGYILCSKNVDTKFEHPLTVFSAEEQEKLGLRYYDQHVHRASFELPVFARKELQHYITRYAKAQEEIKES